jgi:hypothetical protein
MERGLNGFVVVASAVILASIFTTTREGIQQLLL